jgi:hypothetical protein
VQDWVALEALDEDLAYVGAATSIAAGDDEQSGAGLPRERGER